MNHSIPKPDNPNDPLDQLSAFIEIVKIIRSECPWDKSQTHKSISHLLIEEAYEVYDAINKADWSDFPKELGDVLLHIVMHSIMAEEENKFTFADVIQQISEKNGDSPSPYFQRYSGF